MPAAEGFKAHLCHIMKEVHHILMRMIVQACLFTCQLSQMKVTSVALLLKGLNGLGAKPRVATCMAEYRSNFVTVIHTIFAQVQLGRLAVKSGHQGVLSAPVFWQRTAAETSQHKCVQQSLWHTHLAALGCTDVSTCQSTPPPLAPTKKGLTTTCQGFQRDS